MSEASAPGGEAVGERLGFGEWGRLWATLLDQVPPPPGGLAPDAFADLRAVLQRLGLTPSEVADVVSCAPSPESSPDWWWLLERSVGRLVATMGDPDADRGPWPEWVGPECPLERRCFFVLAFAATLPYSLAWRRERGMPDEVTWATMSELSNHMALHRRTWGAECTGVDNAWWITLTLRGELFDLGRLQYNHLHLARGDETPPWYPPDEAASLGSGFLDGDELVGVHIPESGPLSPESCDESFARAEEFFPRFFPLPSGQSRRLATCMSWLLDEQLLDYLPAESNIVKFQRRFEIVPGGIPGDFQVIEFVFRVPLARGQETDPGFLSSLPQRTTLEKAVVSHLLAGGHWHQRTGWVDLAG